MKRYMQIKVLLISVVLIIGFLLIFYGKIKNLSSYYLIKATNNEILSYAPLSKSYESMVKPDYSIGYAIFKNSMGKIENCITDASGKTILETEAGKIVFSEILPLELFSNTNNKDVANTWTIKSLESGEIALEEIEFSNKKSEIHQKYNSLSIPEDFNKDIFFVQPKSFFELLFLNKKDFEYHLFLINEKIKAIKSGTYEYIFFETQNLCGRLEIKKANINDNMPDIVASFGDVNENKWQVVHFFSKGSLSLKEFEILLATFKYSSSEN